MEARQEVHLCKEHRASVSQRASLSACKQTETSRAPHRASCVPAEQPPLTGPSRQLGLITVTLTSQPLPHLLSITTPTLHLLEAMWHPAGLPPPSPSLAGWCVAWAPLC
ncbi:hypothetical protein NQZ68_029324 [Dissostichus eleginoides]|nr:hypothetical protein NQZ68_029324 [Dissostichus eleginoides]